MTGEGGQMEFTDSELCMLEQLTYLSSDTFSKIAKKIGLSGFEGAGAYKGKTIAEMLSKFTDEVLDKLEALGDTDCDNVSAKEWAQIIRYLKSSEMSSLVLTDTMVNSVGNTIALCFAEEGNTTDAIVAFRGTDKEAGEWPDNVEGLNESDTQCQIEALDYIESLPYENITVTGHSKGGNKAMYVAITSDKVTRCVSFDGQGFSQEFLDKYWAEIEEKSGIITCYSVATDFVHVLLFYIPGAEQIYCTGYGISSTAENHSPNSFFVTDEDGNLILDENGNPMFTITSEDESLTMLHEFTTFVLNYASDEDKVLVVGFLSDLLDMIFGKEEGEKISLQEIVDYCADNLDGTAAVIAYLVKYMDEYNLSATDINELLEAIGGDSLGYKLSIFLNLVKDNLNDDDNDWLLKRVVAFLVDREYGDDVDLSKLDIYELWEKINSKVNIIDTSGSGSGLSVKSGIIRDFSKNTYTVLMSAINQIESIGDCSVSSWRSYSGEDWYSSLLISTAVKGISAYFSKLTETNSTCKTQIESIFNEVWTLDTAAGNKLEKVNSSLRKINRSVTSIAGSIAV